MSKVRILSGITTSGIPHLGNYAGAIRPAVQASQREDADSFFFMADYHALVKCEDPLRVAQSRLQIAATWLAAGLDYEKSTFYRQSDIPEIPELNWILACLAPKGLMNRAHAYKASVDQNLEKNEEPDDGINMGLFTYPILMAADILMFNANIVPVGRDQIQHIEMTRDLAQRFNHMYAGGKEYFVLPEAYIEDSVATLPGLDGRKMSKSYNNTIPLFESTSKELKAAISRIQTDSLTPGQAKNPDSSHLFTLYQAFATSAQTEAFANELKQGLGWGEAKEHLYNHLEAIIAPMRDTYHDLMAQPEQIEEILQEGAKKARQEAKIVIEQVRNAVGLRNNVSIASLASTTQSKQNIKKPRFVSFKNEAGQFQFRLLNTEEQELLLSIPFDNPKDNGMAMKGLKNITLADNLNETEEGFEIIHEGQLIAYSNSTVSKQKWKELMQTCLVQLNEK